MAALFGFFMWAKHKGKMFAYIETETALRINGTPKLTVNVQQADLARRKRIDIFLYSEYLIIKWLSLTQEEKGLQ